MTPATGSLVVDVAIRAGVAGLALAGGLVVAAVAARIVLARTERHVQALGARWSRPMLRSLRGELAEVPRLRPSDREAVLRVWLQMADSIEGEGQARLVRFARHAGLDEAALGVLSSRSPVARITAAAVAGRLQMTEAVEGLDAMTRSTHLVERAQAIRALVRIDAEAGLAQAVPLIAGWDDCHPATALTILEDAPVEFTAPAVAAAVVDPANLEHQARMIRVLAGFRHPAALQAARRLLGGRPDPEVAATCLQIVSDHREPADAETVRRYLRHPSSFVRVQAVTALGRFRVRGDEWRLVACLGDTDWWVRYRTAQALVGIPRVGTPLLDTLSHVLPDRYARDALRQAITEVETAA